MSTRVVAGAGPYTITHTWYVDGTATDVGTVTVSITKGDGSAVATDAATTNNNDGTYTYSLASQADPNFLTVVWERADTSATVTDHIEVVGGFLFSEAQARTYGAKANGTGPLASATEYPDATLAETRDRVSDLLESWTHRSWIPRYCRVEAAGNGQRSLLLGDADPRLSDGRRINRPGYAIDTVEILSASIGGVAITASNIKADPANGTLYRTDGSWTAANSSNPRNIVIEYVYGQAYPVDAVDRIALMLTVDQLVPSAISDRAVSFTDELGVFRFETPGRMGNVSTIPEVNAWVKSHNMRIPLG